MVLGLPNLKIFTKSRLFVCGLVHKTINIVLWPPRKFQQIAVALFISLADYLLDKAKTIAQKALLLWLLLATLVIVAALSYAAFYKAYVPIAQIVKPVHLSFSVCSSGIGVCSFPSANVSFWNEEGTMQEILGPGQAYSLLVTLEVPESPRNRDLGMFVVAVKMFDRNGEVSSTSERSTMLRYRSILTRVIEFVGWLPLYFFGFKEHVQTLPVLMFPHLVDNYYHPSVGANVEIRSHGIELYSCTMTLLAKFTGLKYFLYYWPVTSALFAFCTNLVIFSIALGLTMYKRGSDMKALAVSLDLASENNSGGGKRKDGYEAGTKDIAEDDDEEDISLLATTTSGTQTKPSDTSREDGEDDSDTFDDMPLVQEPVDFIPEGEEDEVDIDFVTELRQRRIN